MEVSEEEKVYGLLESVCDPEVPVLSVIDLGVVRSVNVKDNNVHISLTPTYSGCPAMNTIATDIRFKLLSEGYQSVQIETILSPAWTTDWLSEAGKLKLEEYGIAPPVEPLNSMNELFAKDAVVRCPLCKSEHTLLISQFGSTSCKAHFQCIACKEPFDYFKCLK